MSKLPLIDGATMEKLLLERCRRPLIREILQEIKITPEEYGKYLQAK